MIKILLVFLFPILCLSQQEENGCPYDSYCTSAVGAQFRHWQAYLRKHRGAELEKYRQQHGIPFPAWSFSKDIKQTIAWDSICAAHNNPAHPIYQVTHFTKNLRTLPSEIVNDVAFLQQTKSNIVSVPMPRGETPSYIDGTDLVFVRDEDGVYYFLQISSNGALKVISSLLSQAPSETVPCPPELISHFKKSEIHQNYWCKSLQNVQNKQKQIVLMPVRCW